MENNIWENIKENSLSAKETPSPRAWNKLNDLLENEDSHTLKYLPKKWYWLGGIAASFLLFAVLKPQKTTISTENIYAYSMEHLNKDQIDNSPLYDKHKIKGLYKAYELPSIQ